MTSVRHDLELMPTHIPPAVRRHDVGHPVLYEELPHAAAHHAEIVRGVVGVGPVRVTGLVELQPGTRPLLNRVEVVGQSSPRGSVTGEGARDARL